MRPFTEALLRMERIPLKKGMCKRWLSPISFPTRVACPIKVQGQLLGGIAASGAKSEIDEQISQAGIDALLKP